MTERAHAASPVAKVSDAIRNFPATAKSCPLGEGGIAAGDDGRGDRPAAESPIVGTFDDSNKKSPEKLDGNSKRIPTQNRKTVI